MMVEPSLLGLLPYKRGLRKLVWPFHHVRTQLKGTIYEPDIKPSLDNESASVFILDFLASKIGRTILWEQFYVYELPNL